MTEIVCSPDQNMGLSLVFSGCHHLLPLRLKHQGPSSWVCHSPHPPEQGHPPHPFPCGADQESHLRNQLRPAHHTFQMAHLPRLVLGQCTQAAQAHSVSAWGSYAKGTPSKDFQGQALAGPERRVKPRTGVKSGPAWPVMGPACLSLLIAQ